MTDEPVVYQVIKRIEELDASPGDLLVVRPWDPMPISVVRHLGPASLTHLYDHRSHLKQLQPGETPEPPPPPSPRSVLKLVRS